MRRNVILAAALAIAVALAGCSKGEDGTENSNNMELDLKKISEDLRKHIVGTWEHDGSFNMGLPDVTGNTATAHFPYTNGYDFKKDKLTFYADGRLDITLEGAQEPQGTTYNIPDPDMSADIKPIAEIIINLPEIQNYGDYINYTDVRHALFEPDYKTLCLIVNNGYWRYRRIE